MSKTTSAFALKARYLFPVDAPPVTDGVLTIAGDQIVAVGENRSGRPPVDLGNVAVLPGLINAHTHLEFSDLSTPIGQPRMAFTDWIAAVVAHRREQASVSADVANQRIASVSQDASDKSSRHAPSCRPPSEEHRVFGLRHTECACYSDSCRGRVSRGLEECLRLGSTTVAEIATPGWPDQIVGSFPIDTTVYLELLGLSAESIEPLTIQARDHVAAASGGWRAGLSPHAPYTVHPQLLQRAVQVSKESKVPLAMHLAESEGELELLQSGTGPFVELLESLDAWDPSAIARDARPLDYLQALSGSHRVLVVHGNYLNDTEIEFLAARSDRMSVVFCPRTHAYFGHRDYPLAKLLSAGVNVALGTDSRASNPDLSVLEEMRHVYRHCQAVSPADILVLGTSRGARSLGLGGQTGVLAPGRRADLAVVQLPDEDSADPYQLLFGGSGPVVCAYCRGRPYTAESGGQGEPAG